MDDSLKNRALKVLEDDQNQLDGAFDKQTDVTVPEKVEKITVTSDDRGRWTKNTVEEDSNLYDENVVGKIEQQIEDDAKTLQEFCGVLDNQIISFNNQINAKKQQIVTLSIQANNGNCWPGIAIITVSGEGGPTYTDVNCGTYTSIFEDRDALKIYENIAGPNQNFSATNPFSPDSTVTLSPSYSGYGYENVKQNDGGTLLSGVGRTDISTTLTDHNARSVGINTYYNGSTIPPSTCVSIANSITTLLSEINALRTQRDAAVNRTNLNSVKTVKSEKELQNWGCKNLRKRVDARKTKNASTISIVKSMI